MLKDIQESLHKAQAQVIKLRRTNTRYIYVSLIASVLATLIAGSTVFLGPLFGAGTTSWKWTCGVVAVFTATATIFTGLHKQLSVTERLAKATECVGKLKAIEFDFENTKSNTDELKKEYKRVIELYSEYLI